ncbi:MAG: tRNA (N(6)-L-threonylcarbamoyladenosine(37)-C(2))-methylthiotransferase MtaB [Simkaniaceae bacterium]
MEKDSKGKKKFKIVTLGCRTNQYESQAYNDQLEAMGFSQAEDNEPAEICVINTCTVTESADRRSYYQLRQLIKNNPYSQILVTGCLAERHKRDLEKIRGVSHVVPNKEKDRLLSYAFPYEELPEFKIQRFEAHTRAFVKIQDGCNSYCSYCIIPFVRGRSRSKKVPEILSEARDLVANGYKEIVLTGINIGDFDGGAEPGQAEVRLSSLVREIDKIEGLERIRISSIDPDEVDDDLLKAVIEGKKTCPSMHIVLQAGSNAVLKRMNRKYTKQDFLRTVARLKKAHSDFTFTTDVIVGFPGETAEDFAETLEIIEEVKFAKVHMFPYSVRPKTRASRFTDPVPEEEIRFRKQQLLRKAEQAAFSLRNAYVGRKLKVLTEAFDQKTDSMKGHSDNFLEVLIKGKKMRPNELVEVVCVRNEPEGLVAELI